MPVLMYLLHGYKCHYLFPLISENIVISIHLSPMSFVRAFFNHNKSISLCKQKDNPTSQANLMIRSPLYIDQYLLFFHLFDTDGSLTSPVLFFISQMTDFPAHLTGITVYGSVSFSFCCSVLHRIVFESLPSFSCDPEECLLQR